MFLVFRGQASPRTENVEGFGRQYMESVEAESPDDALYFLREGRALCDEGARGDYDLSAAIRRADPSFPGQPPRDFVTSVYKAAVENLCPWRDGDLGTSPP